MNKNVLRKLGAVAVFVFWATGAGVALPKLDKSSLMQSPLTKSPHRGG